MGLRTLSFSGMRCVRFVVPILRLQGKVRLILLLWSATLEAPVGRGMMGRWGSVGGVVVVVAWRGGRRERRGGGRGGMEGCRWRGATGRTTSNLPGTDRSLAASSSSSSSLVSVGGGTVSAGNGREKETSLREKDKQSGLAF